MTAAPVEQFPESPINGSYCAEYRQRFNEDVLLPLADEYFQSSMEGWDRVESAMATGRPIVFVGNHSGGSLSWDNIIFQALFDRELSDRPGKIVRLVHRRLYDDDIAPYGIPGWWKKMGCVEATYQNLDDLLLSGHRYIYLSPEGVEGLGKATWRYRKLRPFSSSFVSVAKRHGAFVVPVAMHNTQYLNPATWTYRWTNRLADRLLRWPYLPLGPGILLVMFPLFFIQPWPTRIRYEFLEPLHFSGDPAHLERNRAEAQGVRLLIESALEAGRTGVFAATHWRSFLDSPIRFWNTFVHFFETHTGRSIRFREAMEYIVPFCGYALVRRRHRSTSTNGE